MFKLELDDEEARTLLDELSETILDEGSEADKLACELESYFGEGRR